MNFPELSRLRWSLGIIGLLLIMFSLWKLKESRSGLLFDTFNQEGLPVQLIRPADLGNEKRPLILVAHGLAGSGTIMQGLALSFAHAGYVVVSWDFDGHAGNSRAMEMDIYSPWLLANVEEVLALISAYEEIDTSRMAIVGHSMGTAAALSFAQEHPSVRAAVAISPVATPVTKDLPHNLLLMAGELEPAFVGNARARLEEAGGIGGDLMAGTARDFKLIPGVEHISIIFAPTTHQLALDWVNQTFGDQPGAQSYNDKRLLWLLLLIIGVLTLGFNIPIWYSGSQTIEDIPYMTGVLAIIFSTLIATSSLWLLSQFGLSMSTILGLRTGGYLVVWLLIAGVLGLLMTKVLPTKPEKVELIGGLLMFTVLWLGVGLVGGAIWLPWLLISPRLFLFPLVALALFPWFYFIGTLGAKGGAKTRLFWWAIQSLLMCIVLLLSIRITPGLSFLILLLPLFPLVFLIHTVPSISQRGSWSFALSGSLFVAWMTLAVFPLI